MNDQLLIAQFEPVLQAAVPQDGPGTSVVVHAELLHQLMVAESLLELLDWSRQGTAADPLGCFWLGSLRWYRLLHGEFPLGCPQPPRLPTDHALELLLTSEALSILPGSGQQAARGLDSSEMAYPSSPAQPELMEDSALLRLMPLGLVPYVEQKMLKSWTEQLLALTHGARELTATATHLVLTLRDLALQETPEAEAAIASALEPISAPVAALLEPQLRAAATPATQPSPSQPSSEPTQSLLGVVVEHLGQRWRATTLDS